MHLLPLSAPINQTPLFSLGKGLKSEGAHTPTTPPFFSNPTQSTECLVWYWVDKDLCLGLELILIKRIENEVVSGLFFKSITDAYLIAFVACSLGTLLTIPNKSLGTLAHFGNICLRNLSFIPSPRFDVVHRDEFVIARFQHCRGEGVPYSSDVITDCFQNSLSMHFHAIWCRRAVNCR